MAPDNRLMPYTAHPFWGYYASTLTKLLRCARGRSDPPVMTVLLPRAPKEYTPKATLPLRKVGQRIRTPTPAIGPGTTTATPEGSQ